MLPPLVFIITKRICLGLQRRDREKVLHGRETGTVVRTEPASSSRCTSLSTLYTRWTLVQHETFEPVGELPTEDANGVRRPGGALSGLRKRISNFYYEDRVAPVTPAELEAAHHEHGGHDEHADHDVPALDEQRGHGHASVGGGQGS